LSVAVALFWASLYTYVPILPAYAQTLGASLTGVGLIVGSYGLTQALLRIPFGLYADVRGVRKPVVLFGFAVSFAGACGLAASSSPGLLYASRALTGVAASTWVAASVMLATYFPAGKTVRATGLALFLTAGAQILATSSGGLMAQHWGWKAPFAAAAILAVGGGLVLSRAPEEAVPRGDFRGGGLVFREVAGRSDLIFVSIAAAVVHYVSASTTGGFVPVYAGQLGASKAELGWVTTAVMAAHMLVSLLAGPLSERLGEQRHLILGAGVLAVSTASVPLSTSIAQLVGLRLLYGVGTGLVNPLLMGLSIKNVPSDRRVAAMGVFQAVYAIGMFTGPSVSGVLADRWGEPAVFWFGAVLCVGVAVAGLVGRRWLGSAAKSQAG
jgi:MFS family permease